MVRPRLSRRHALLGAGAAASAAGAGWIALRPPRATVREVASVVPALATRDGAGVKLARLVGGPMLPMLDPFLLLDEFRSRHAEDFARGFPDHPHRGFETVTIMLDGHVVHQDSVGNRGDIAGGGVQWMTAGRGIIHSEMPRAGEASGELFGFQLWVNLPARLKMTAPRYQDLPASAFDEVAVDDARVRVLAGALGGARGGVTGVAVDPTLLDARLEAGARLRTRLAPAHNVMLVVATGRAAVGDLGREVDAGSVAVLGPGEALSLRAIEPSRVLVFAAAPIGEPVARRGPFVMNTDDEIRRAFEDYRAGRLVG